MIEMLKPFHIACAALTILFFIFRGVISMRAPAFVDWPWVRRTAASVDTLLLFSGVALAWLSGFSPLEDQWLALKLGLILLYILFGMVAFHWGKSFKIRLSSWLLALGTFAMIVHIAIEKGV